VNFNTQSSSQWDGFSEFDTVENYVQAFIHDIGHWGHVGSMRHYNGMKHDDMLGNEEASIHRMLTSSGKMKVS
jgi:hypothetical protein